MRKKVLSLILLWAALLALALIYTDRDEYTWRYEGGELAQIVITREEADARQKQADEAMALMQQAAQARTDAGLWGSENEWEDDFLPAQGENGGLNLMWGDYQATIEYEDAARMDAHVVSAGYQAFIENGDAHDEAEAENVLLHRLSFVFRLTDSTPNLYLASENPEAIRAVTVHKVGAGVLSADLCAYAALVGAVLTALLVLSWDQTERGRKNRRDMAVVLCAAAFACMPLRRARPVLPPQPHRGHRKRAEKRAVPRAHPQLDAAGLRLCRAGILPRAVPLFPGAAAQSGRVPVRVCSGV